MVKIRFAPSGVVAEVEEGTTILEAARKIGLLIESPCNGMGVCGKCRVKVKPEQLSLLVQGGKHELPEEDKAQGIVLACASKVMGDIDVELFTKTQNKTLKILSEGQSFDITIDTFIKKKFDGQKTLVYGGDKVIGEEEGDTTDKLYGVVVDIGTTTVVSALINMHTGEELASVSALNPQALHAQDVLSRIQFASEPGGLKTMYDGITEEIDKMIDTICKEADVDKKYVYEVIFSGNTCMIHLATNVDPTSLGRYPYDPQIRGGNHVGAKDHKLNISPFGLIYLPPIISSYVGPDITSGVLASRLQDKDNVTLFVDIGTNGEMVITNKGKLSASSTAAGPAFEGMNITYGMRAAKGSIEVFDVDDEGKVSIKTIGDAKAVGICGSGLLDIVGELVHCKVINKLGKIVKPDTKGLSSDLASRITTYEGKPAFTLEGEVVLTQRDIRQVQLAKGAIRAGIEFLMKSKGVTAEQVDEVQIAGSFGYHLRAKSLINLGLLPKEFDGKVKFVGNTSNSGGKAFLLNTAYRDEMEKLVKDIEVVELANGEDFDKVFVASLNF